MMKQYHITTQNLPTGSSDDAYIAPDDPVHAIRASQEFDGLTELQRLAGINKHKFTESDSINVSITGTEKQKLERDNNIKPGTPEWFQLWFSRPYLTGEKPV
jgi:hypothetical protein